MASVAVDLGASIFERKILAIRFSTRSVDVARLQIGLVDATYVLDKRIKDKAAVKG